MLYIRTLLSPRSRSTQEAHVSDLLSKTGVKGHGQLKEQSNQYLIKTLGNSQAPDKFMRALLGKLLQLETPDELAKLLALMHSTVCIMDYEGKVLNELSNLRIGSEVNLKGEALGWFLPFYKAYISYLARLPSVGQVFLRAKYADLEKLSCEIMLQDIYRLINQINLISDVLSVIFNTIGRYYKDQIKTFQALYQVIWTQLMIAYDYMRRVINRTFIVFQEVRMEKLRVFLDVVGEVELLVDKMEDFLMNKYFAKNKLDERVYLPAEKLAKIEYFLGQNQRNSPRRSSLKV